MPYGGKAHTEKAIVNPQQRQLLAGTEGQGAPKKILGIVKHFGAGSTPAAKILAVALSMDVILVKALLILF